mgnify:CR=1 FL=1
MPSRTSSRNDTFHHVRCVVTEQGSASRCREGGTTNSRRRQMRMQRRRTSTQTCAAWRGPHFASEKHCTEEQGGEGDGLEAKAVTAIHVRHGEEGQWSGGAMCQLSWLPRLPGQCHRAIISQYTTRLGHWVRSSAQARPRGNTQNHEKLAADKSFGWCVVRCAVVDKAEPENCQICGRSLLEIVTTVVQVANLTPGPAALHWQATSAGWPWRTDT